NGNVHVNAAATPSTVSGVVALSNAGHTFNVADGAAADDLLVSAVVTGGGTNTTVLTKNGTGLMSLSGANTFAGRVTVAFGILDIRNSLALGAPDGTAQNDTTVNAGATLRLNGSGLLIGNELLTLNGAAVGSGATLADGTLVQLDNAA